MGNKSSWGIASALAIAVCIGLASLAWLEKDAGEVRGRFVKGDPDGNVGGDADAKVKGDSDRNARTSVGGNERGPLAAEEEAYALRAYPAADIPFQATLNAQAAMASISSRSGRRPGNWVLVGPSTAQLPGLLTFPALVNTLGSGGTPYVTSGRITALAIGPTCTPRNCRVYVGAAGGGIWRTTTGLGASPLWTFISGGLGSNAIGTLEVDPNDPTGNTIYAGTGEANASGDSEAGVGIYKTTDGGNTWALLGTSGTIGYGRAIGSIAIHPFNANIIYAAVARAVRGVSSVSGGATSNPPVAAALGLYQSVDGGATWSIIWNGNTSIRGVRRVAIDPQNPNTVYASAFQHGLWRSPNGGPFEQVFAPGAPASNVDRTEFALTVKSGLLRIYVGDGQTGAPAARFYRVDNANVAAATLTTGGTNGGWTLLSSSNPADPRYGAFNYCTGQCWYDNYVYTPPGHPDIVYLGGSYQYGEIGGVSNGRGVVLSTNAGQTFTDMTWDATSDTAPNGLHPDHHHLVTNPSDPLTFFSGSDGGIVRNDGTFSNISYQCAGRGLTAAGTIACNQLLSRVPSRLINLNNGLSTLQFQSLSVDPANSSHLQGGTQDNGTFQTVGSTLFWPQIIYGDGGQSGFSSNNSARRFNTFTGQANDVNFQNGDPTKWVIATGPIVSSPEASLFYPPVIADPHASNGGTIFQGSFSVWRTQNWGGNQAFLEANCPEFTTSAADPSCGDFVRIGPAGAEDLGASAADYRGTTRGGGFVGAFGRTTGDVGTLWVATTTGRVFISKNANAAAGAVTFTRLDTLSIVDPQRFISSIHVDPANPNRAWVSYSGYNFNTPAEPGHVFEVVYNPMGPTATWTNLDGGTGPMGDLPVTALVRDDPTGDLYAGTDFGVLLLPNGSATWVAAANGLPAVEVAGLTIVPAARKLYAATHGRSAWVLALP